MFIGAMNSALATMTKKDKVRTTATMLVAGYMHIAIYINNHIFREFDIKTYVWEQILEVFKRNKKDIYRPEE